MLGVAALPMAQQAIGQTRPKPIVVSSANAFNTELALTLEDVLARRTRALFLNARAALRMAPRVADLMAGELGRDAAWKSLQLAAFAETAKGYLLG